MSLQRHLVRRTNLLGASSNISLEVALPVLDPTQLLSLNCFVLGDGPDRMFTVKILKTENVSILKDRIKEKKAPHLNHIAASDLDLWQVNCLTDDLPSNSPPTGPSLRSEKLLLDLFSAELDNNRVHVVAYAPVKGKYYYMDSGLILLIIPFSRVSGYRRRGERSDQGFE